MRLTIRPLNEPSLEIDITERVIHAIAEQLATHAGGNEALNRLEASVHLENLLRARGTSLETDDAAIGARP